MDSEGSDISLLFLYKDHISVRIFDLCPPKIIYKAKMNQRHCPGGILEESFNKGLSSQTKYWSITLQLLLLLIVSRYFMVYFLYHINQLQYYKYILIEEIYFQNSVVKNWLKQIEMLYPGQCFWGAETLLVTNINYQLSVFQ